MSSSPLSALPGTVTQYFPFCSTIMTHILTKSDINLMVKLSKSCKYFYQKFFYIVDDLEIDKNKVNCFKNEQSWNMPLGWILKYGITVTDKLSIISSNAAVIGQFLGKIHFSTIQELFIFETYISERDMLRLTESGSIKKFKVISNDDGTSSGNGLAVTLTTDYLIKLVSNATEIHIEQNRPTNLSQLININREVKIQKLAITGCFCSIFENNFLKNNLAPKAEVKIGFTEPYRTIHRFRDTVVKDILDTWEPKEERPLIVAYAHLI